MADDFAKKNPDFALQADRVARDQFALMSMNPRMKRADALNAVLSRTKVKNGKIIFNSFNRKEWLSVGDSEKLHRMRKAADRLFPFGVKQTMKDPIVDEQMRSGVLSKLRELNERQERQMKSLTAEEAETVDNEAGTVDSDGAFSGKEM